MKRWATMLIIFVGATSCTGTDITGSTTPGVSAFVMDVPDGDSLLVRIDGTEERVRLIGVNAPEHDECFGAESATGLRSLISDTEVSITTDVEARDQFGRLLGYVYHAGALINEEVAFRGFALARAYEPNTARQEQIDAAGRDAQQNQRGMWAPTACASASGASVAVTKIEANPPGPDEDNLNGEMVIIANTGHETIDLTGWSLRDASSVHRYSFPIGAVLDPDASLVVHTGCGEDDTDHRYWCADGPVWGNAGDSALLLDAEGRMAAIFDY